MIHIAVSAQRVFTVPADLARTTSHFRDFGHTLDYLAPHLRLAATYARDQYRMLYSVTEAGVYRVAFYCDIQVQYDESSQILRVTPLEGVPPVAPKATLNSLTGQGYLSQPFGLSVRRPAHAHHVRRRDRGRRAQAP